MKKSTKLALLALTSFILSGVFAWVGGETTNGGLEAWCFIASVAVGVNAILAVLGTFADWIE